VPLVAAAVLAFLTVDVVRDDGIVAIDLHVRSWTSSHQVHWLHVLADLTTDVLSPPIVVLAFLIVAAVSRRIRLWEATAIVVVELTAMISMKAAVGRPTPLHPSHFYGDFPSGHTVTALTCAGAAILLSDLPTRWARRLWVTVTVATTVLAASLIYIGAHWLSDTIAAVALGVLILWAVAVTRPASDPRSLS
jgi:membrane-associated phospholipid phosphatase